MVNGRRTALILVALFGSAFLVRLLLAIVILPNGGHRTDIQLLMLWEQQLHDHGLAAFYRPNAGYFSDYPPIYLYVLWLTGVLGRAWAATFGGPGVTPLLLKLPFMLADLGAAAFVFLLVRRLFGSRAAVIGAALFLFNPGVILVSTVWGQNDAIPTMLVLACAWLLVSGRLEWAAVTAVLAMLVKFQYAFLIPIVAVVGLKRDLFGRSSDREFDGGPDPRRIAISLLAAILTLAVVCLPFGLVPFDPGTPSRSLFHHLLGAAGSFPGVTQNAFNLWMNPILDIVRVDATGQTAGHVVDDLARVGIGGLTVSLQSIGGLLFIGTVGLALLVVRRRDDGLAIVFVALVIAVAFFALPTRVHERYLYPAVALGIPFVFVSSRAWRFLYAIVTAVLFLDVYWAYTFPVGNLGLGRGILAWTVFSPAGIYLLSFATVVSMAWLVLRSLDPMRLPWGRSMPSDAAANAIGARMDDGARPASWPGRGSSAGGGVGAAVSGLRAAPARLHGRLQATEDWLRGRAPSSGRAIGAIAFLSLGAALIAAQVGVVPGKWLWNLDMPKLDFPLAQIFHDALASGRLPLWNDNLGLGFPLYAEGQIGAFYPPNWLIFRLPPFAALDVTRVLHLGLAGTGAGVLALRLTGSRAGSLVAALCAVLGGAIATKLEWHNLVAAYGWMPWVLVPLVRRPGPTRLGLVLAGVTWGIQALAGHPNTWLLTGLAAAVVMVATRPRWVTLARVLGFGLLGAAVGAVQLIPTAILTTLSVRSVALSASDLFASAATPFDILGFGFGNPFVQAGPDGVWNLPTGWYPDGSFALFEAGAYVGLPVLVLAAVGMAARRARPLVVTILVMLAIPVVAAFKPAPWTVIPILNALRSPVRSYVVVALLLGVLAAVGIGRLARRGQAGANHPGWLGTATHRAELAIQVMVIAYALILGLARVLPGTFEDVYYASSTFLGRSDLPNRQELAVAALSAPWPLVAEIALGALAVLIVLVARDRPGIRRSLALAAVLVAVAPLALFAHAPNGVHPEPDFNSADSDFVLRAQATAAHRLVTIHAPGWYEGMPDQLAAAAVPDIRMFSSLDLLASDQLVTDLDKSDQAEALRRALGIDVVVTFDTPCEGTPIGHVDHLDVSFCRDPMALDPPYWLPFADATIGGGSGSSASADAPRPAGGSLVRPQDATLALPAVLGDARSADVVHSEPGLVDADVDAPADGWVWIDRAWWPGWRVSIDGTPVQAARALGGLLVAVPAGSHELRAELVPWDAALGLGLGIGAILVAIAWAGGLWSDVAARLRRGWRKR